MFLPSQVASVQRVLSSAARGCSARRSAEAAERAAAAKMTRNRRQIPQLLSTGVETAWT